MREFMDWIQTSFYEATGWNRENSYSNLNATADSILGFEVPRGLRFTLSSLATPHFASSYQLGSLGIVDGSIAYLYSTAALNPVSASSDIRLQALLRSYRLLTPLNEFTRISPLGIGPPVSSRPAPKLPHPEDETDPSSPPVTNAFDTAAAAVASSISRLRTWYNNIDWTPDALMYGRLYLPASQLEALALRRVTPRLQVQLSAVSDSTLRNGGTILGVMQYDTGKFGLEGLLSTDGGLLGIRGLYNLGGDASKSPSLSPNGTTDEIESGHGAHDGHSNGHVNGNGNSERIYGRSSIGAELYYGTLNKSGGMSVGGRFSTLPTHNGFPITATMTVNPLMGSFSTTYAVMAGPNVSIASRLDFNVYSYESYWTVGFELWRRRWGRTVVAPPEAEPAEESPYLVKEEGHDEKEKALKEWQDRERSRKAKLSWQTNEEVNLQEAAQEEQRLLTLDRHAGVLKARLDQDFRLGLVWEGRAQSLLFSLGTGVDLRRPDQPFRTLGLEVQFSR